MALKPSQSTEALCIATDLVTAGNGRSVRKDTACRELMLVFYPHKSRKEKYKMKKFNTAYIIVLVVVASIGGVVGKGLVADYYEKANNEIIKKAFIVGCLKNGGNEPYCECSYNTLIEKYTYEGYREMGRVISKNGIDSPEAATYKPVLLKEIPEKCNMQ